jgi:serine/threonine-protein kinase
MQAESPEPETWIGQKIGNHRLVRVLGRGGMGMVFEAVHDGVLGRAAIKILRPDVTSRADVTTRFFNEARAANSVNHPGIVRIFDCGFTEAGVAYLSMEFLEGESLRTRLAREHQLPVKTALRIARQIASALFAAHRVNIIHRDLKPDNVMLVPDPDVPGGERVKILDFGIATFTRCVFVGCAAFWGRNRKWEGIGLVLTQDRRKGAFA